SSRICAAGCVETRRMTSGRYSIGLTPQASSMVRRLQSNDTRLALDALGESVRQRRPPRGLMHHSDRGSPYGSDDYVAELDRLGFVRSMSRKGTCWDNA